VPARAIKSNSDSESLAWMGMAEKMNAKKISNADVVDA